MCLVNELARYNKVMNLHYLEIARFFSLFNNLFHKNQRIPIVILTFKNLFSKKKKLKQI